MSKTVKSSRRHAITLPTREQDAAILAAAKSDPDAQPLTAAQLAAMVPLRSLRGRPKSASKKLLLSVRYSPEVVAYFKSTGEGWQSRMDGVLRNYVSRSSRNVKVVGKRKANV
jgi:uncharacterized protein (DUF4415 family)